MDRNALFEIFMERGIDAVVAYHEGNLEQFLVSKEIGGDDLGDFTDDEFDRDEDDIWRAAKSLTQIFKTESACLG